MKNLLLLISFCLISLGLQAQSKHLTMEDVSGRNSSLYPKTMQQLQWMGDQNSFAWVAVNSLIRGTVKNEKTDTLLTLDALNLLCDSLLPEKMKRFPLIQFLPGGNFRFTEKGNMILYSFKDGTAEKINSYNPDAETVEIHDSSFRAAFTFRHDVYISMNHREIRVTNDGSSGLEYGASVHRNEFGINGGLFWSPDGNMLAFYRMDQSMVTDYPLVDISQRTAKVSATKYPMAGMTSHEVTVCVYHLSSGKTIFLNTEGRPDQYLTNITWSPDSKSIYIAVLNRDQNHMQLNRYNPENGKYTGTLFEEKDNEYVEPLRGLFFLPNHPEQFIWMSQRDGFTHLYLYSTDDTLISQLTQGSWVVTGFSGFDEKGTRAFFTGNREDPLDEILYSVELKSGKIHRITQPNGTHNVTISKEGKYILDQFSSLNVASQTQLLTGEGKVMRVLQSDYEPLADYSLGETTVFTVAADDGVPLYCRLIKPSEFDSTRKYPVIIYVYGGPHSQLVTDSWLGGAGFYLNYLADQGFAVFTLDNRGTANRGADFEQAIFRTLGTLETTDQMTGVRYLKSLPWVDSTRIGVTGWSYGGFMTLSMTLRNPGVFKVAVAGGPVIDWKYYEVMYGERYMDTPESNPEGYESASLLNRAKSLTGKVLIIQGDMDETVVPQNALSFVKKCIEEDVMVDLMIYPGHSHGVRGKDRVHLNRKIFEYFRDNL
jgi:dipeptidyl-peptidase-4